MSEVTKTRILALLVQMDQELSVLASDTKSIRDEARAVRLRLQGLSEDVSNLRRIMDRNDDRLCRIETRLGLLEPAH